MFNRSKLQFKKSRFSEDYFLISRPLVLNFTLFVNLKHFKRKITFFEVDPAALDSIIKPSGCQKETCVEKSKRKLLVILIKSIKINYSLTIYPLCKWYLSHSIFCFRKCQCRFIHKHAEAFMNAFANESVVFTCK